MAAAVKPGESSVSPLRSARRFLITPGGSFDASRKSLLNYSWPDVTRDSEDKRDKLVALRVKIRFILRIRCHIR
jgi:hypothetical protein